MGGGVLVLAQEVHNQPAGSSRAGDGQGSIGLGKRPREQRTGQAVLVRVVPHLECVGTDYPALPNAVKVSAPPAQPGNEPVGLRGEVIGRDEVRSIAVVGVPTVAVFAGFTGVGAGRFHRLTAGDGEHTGAAAQVGVYADAYQVILTGHSLKGRA